MKKELNALKKSSLGSLNRERFGICRAYVKGVKLSWDNRQKYNIFMTLTKLGAIEVMIINYRLRIKSFYRTLSLILC
jgi:hypothetical protein